MPAVPSVSRVETTCFNRKGDNLLTEAEVERSFRKIFSSREVQADDFEKAETLIDNLRLESPLRHRLTNELDELRKLCGVEG